MSVQIMQLLHQAHSKTGKERQSLVLTVLEAIDAHRQTRRTPLHLSGPEWDMLTLSVERYESDPEWRRLRKVMLVLCIHDLSHCVRLSTVSYFEKLHSLNRVVNELSPESYFRRAFVNDKSPEYQTFILPLIAQTLEIARKLGVPVAIERLEEYRGRRFTFRRFAVPVDLNQQPLPTKMRRKGIPATAAPAIVTGV